MTTYMVQVHMPGYMSEDEDPYITDDLTDAKRALASEIEYPATSESWCEGQGGQVTPAELHVVVVGTTPNDGIVDVDAAGFWIHGPFASLADARDWAADVEACFERVDEQPDTTWPYGYWFVEVRTVLQVTDAYSAAANWFQTKEDK